MTSKPPIPMPKTRHEFHLNTWEDKMVGIHTHFEIELIG
jgi:hypothetical protein